MTIADELEALAKDDAAAHIRAQSEEIAWLKAENERLSTHVMSGILPNLLNKQETNELVKFVKFLRQESACTALKEPGA